MGANCSCINRATEVKETDDNTINMGKVFQEKQESGVVEVEPVKEHEFNLDQDSVPIQSAVRGYFARKDINLRAEAAKNRKVFDPEENFEILNGKIEDVEDSLVKTIESKLPELKITPIEGDHEKVQVKRALKLKDGSVYEGG